MRAQGSGAIVNCSSLGGLVGNPGRAVLPRHQARRPRPHQERRAGIRAARHPHQRRLPRHDRDPDGRRHDRQRRTHASPTPSRASRSAASAAETRSPPPCCGCAAPARASWSASRCPSTAATPPAEPRPRRSDHDEPLQLSTLALVATRSSSHCSPPCRSRLVAAQTRTATRPRDCSDATHATAVAEPDLRRAGRRRLGRHADPDHVRRHRAHRAAARQRHGTRSRRPTPADAHLPRPQQRREDRAAAPRAVARRRARRARSRRRRHRLLGARRRLGPLLRRRRPVLGTASCASASSTATWTRSSGCPKAHA